MARADASLIRAAIAGAVITTAVSACMPYYVEDEPGGNLATHLQRAAYAEADGIPIRVTGTCKSACTTYLKSKTTCAGPDAEFWFHAPTPDTQATRLALLSSYPAHIRDWIKRSGGLTSDWMILKGEEMRRLVPQCDRLG